MKILTRFSCLKTCVFSSRESKTNLTHQCEYHDAINAHAAHLNQCNTSICETSHCDCFSFVGWIVCMRKVIFIHQSQSFDWCASMSKWISAAVLCMWKHTMCVSCCHGADAHCSSHDYNRYCVWFCHIWWLYEHQTLYYYFRSVLMLSGNLCKYW